MDKYKTAKAISTFTNPPIICIPLFLLISVVLSFENGTFNLSKFIVLELISIVFASALPMAIIVFWAKKLNTDSDISNREDRFIPLIIGVVSYFIGFLISLILDADNFLTVLLLCYGVNTFIVMLITTKWKISVHTTGLSGPVGALILLLGPFGAILGILYPILIWSRVTLKKHTLSQAICGGVQGFFLTIFEMYLFINILHFDVGNIIGLDLATWFVLAIIATPVLLGILSYADMGHSKVVFYIFEVVFSLTFLAFAPLDVFIIFLAVTAASVIISYFAGAEFVWFRVMNSS